MLHCLYVIFTLHCLSGVIDAWQVIASRLDYRRRRQQVVSPAINIDRRRRMSVIGAGMGDQYGSGPTGGGPPGGIGIPEGGLRMSMSGFGPSGAPGAGSGGFSAPEGVGRRLSIFGSMADQGPPPEPMFISPEHKEVKKPCMAL